MHTMDDQERQDRDQERWRRVQVTPVLATQPNVKGE